MVTALAWVGALQAAHTTPVTSCEANTPDPSIHCGTTPTATFDNRGRLWLAFEHRAFVYVTYSDDKGSTFSPAVRVNDVAEEIYTNGENRPKIAIGAGNEIYVSWTKVTDGRFSGDIRFSRSLDAGKSFDPVRTINDDGLITSHRFESLVVDRNGTIFLVWIDKRDQQAALARGDAVSGAAIYYATSTDTGATFASNRKAVDSSCECCRIAIAANAGAGAAIFYRALYADNIRDHGLVVLGRERLLSPLQRATFDNWQIDACPHHGPAMITAGDGGLHLAWFTGGSARTGIYYGHYDLKAGHMSDIKPMTSAAGASHPYLAENGGRLLLAWKEFDGEKTHVMLAVSLDDGRSWQDAISVAATSDASDHPFMLVDGENAYLSWQTSQEGFQLMPVPATAGKDNR